VSRPCRARFARLIERAFVRGLPARQRRQLREHLESCEGCREHWERLATIDRQLGGPALSETVLADIAEVAVGPTRRPWRAWAAGGVAVAAAVTIAIVVLRPVAGPDVLTPRGETARGRTPGARLFCVAGDRDHVRAEVRMVSSGVVPELRCTIADDLQIAYTTPNREGLTLVAVGRLQAMDSLASTFVHYADPIAVAPDRIDELLDWSTRLAAEHVPGIYDVSVRFYDRGVAPTEAITELANPIVELRARLVIGAREELVP
jgi:hypothetical protein